MLSKKIEEALTRRSTPNYGRLTYTSPWPHTAIQTASRAWASGMKCSSRRSKTMQRYSSTTSSSAAGTVTLKPIDAVPTEWKSLLDVFESTLAHEQKVTALINELFALTAAEKDYATQSALKWFIDEQVEEEETAQNIIDNLKMIQDNGYGLYMLDKELGARTYTQAAPLASAQ